ncbi:MAG: prepilin-type N-terminal cleavage/methylation domain-containing protein [Kiritimatiellia bacterium]
MRISRSSSNNDLARHSDDARDGFTLLEVLIASAVAVLVVAASLATLASGFRVFASLRNASNRTLAERHLLFETLEADLSAAAPMYTHPIPFQGEKDSLSLMRLWSNYRTEHSIRPVRILWVSTNGGMERMLFAPGEEEPFRTERFSCPESIRFEYGTQIEQEKEADFADATADEEMMASPVVWQESWAKKELPMAVRIACGDTVLEVSLYLSRPERKSAEKEAQP